MQKTKKTIILISVSAILLLSFFSFKILDDGDDFEIAKSFDIFHSVVREIRLFYVDDAEISELINESTNEFLAKLDPYTVFYPESKIEDFSFMTTGAYGGVGAILLDKKKSLLFVNVYKDSPADNAGLKVGDEIVEVNNIQITEKNISDVKQLLKGEPGSTIEISIKRFGKKQNIIKKIVREKIVIENIPHAELFDDNFAYVKLNAFKRGAGNDIKTKLLELKSKNKFKGIILDLRNNPGGLLNEAVEIVNLFVEKGSKIVSTKGKMSSWNTKYIAKREPIFPKVPLVVLINSNSASASEIVSGAIQDLDRGIVIGQRSFGKGLVQTTRKLSYNTRIKITTAKYYIPSGRCIQALDYSNRNEDGSVGHVPDSLISEFQTKNGRKVYDGGGINPDIIIPFDTLSYFSKQLINNNAIFNFSTQYYYENPKINNAEKFNISDEIFNEFIAFLIEEKYEINSGSYYLTDELLEIAKDEKYSSETINEIEKLKQNLNIDIKKEASLYKNQIIPILDKEITGRYYYDNGRVISAIEFDKELEEAKNVLNDTSKFILLLSNK